MTLIQTHFLPSLANPTKVTILRSLLRSISTVRMSTSSSVRPASPSNTAAPPSKQAKLSPTTLQILLDPQHPEAKLPTRGSQFAAGYDLYASETKTIARGGRSIIQTGIRLRVPQDCYGRVAPRSGLGESLAMNEISLRNERKRRREMRVARRKWNGRTKVEMEDVASHL